MPTFVANPSLRGADRMIVSDATADTARFAAPFAELRFKVIISPVVTAL
jgi:hypothetical protein